MEIVSSAEEKIRDKGLIPLIPDVNVDRIPLSDKSIDVIIFEEVIEHLYNSDLVMIEIKRLLKEGGTLVLSTPNLPRG